MHVVCQRLVPDVAHSPQIDFSQHLQINLPLHNIKQTRWSSFSYTLELSFFNFVSNYEIILSQKFLIV